MNDTAPGRWPWLALALGGCATVAPGSSYERASHHITEATGEAQIYRPGEEEAARDRVTLLLADGLTAVEATQVALLNNRSVHAAFLRIGVRQADLVQSGLFTNPSLFWALGFPAGGGLVSLEGGLGQSIADLWQIPVRKRVAERELNRVILEVARLASLLVLDVKRAYFEAVASEQSVEIANDNLGVARQLLELALARQEAGAGDEVDVNAARSEVLAKEVLVRQKDLRAFEARQRLLTLLGLSSAGTTLQLLNELPEPPTWTVTSELLLELARNYRLDLRSAEESVAMAKARFQAQQRLFVRVVEPGVAVEREQRKSGEDHELTIGPTLSLELPLFDQNQAQIARARFEVQAATKLLEGLLLSITGEVHLAHKRAEILWSLNRFYKDQVLPQERRSLELALDAYRIGETSFLSVLEAQKSFLAAREEYLDTQRASANSIVDLEQVTGQPLSRMAPITRNSEDDP